MKAFRFVHACITNAEQLLTAPLKVPGLAGAHRPERSELNVVNEGETVWPMGGTGFPASLSRENLHLTQQEIPV
jgi:hypothetical protein